MTLDSAEKIGTVGGAGLRLPLQEQGSKLMPSVVNLNLDALAGKGGRGCHERFASSAPRLAPLPLPLLDRDGKFSLRCDVSISEHL